jgi:hydrogenase nickel incorporation protein HypB
MCTTCGCGAGGVRVDGKALSDPESGLQANGADAPSRPDGASGIRYSRVADRHAHAHHAASDHLHSPTPDGPRSAGDGQAAAAAPARRLQIERDLLARNDGLAAGNRRRFDEQGIFALNLVSSPGSGKTTCSAGPSRPCGQMAITVIEGDQQTSRDAERIRATGAPALQINTGKGCHLDAHMVGHACTKLSPADDSLLLIENVGNLVCPAAFDLGEAHKVVILSVTEGEDKPLKYPDMFPRRR